MFINVLVNIIHIYYCRLVSVDATSDKWSRTQFLPQRVAKCRNETSTGDQFIFDIRNIFAIKIGMKFFQEI